MVEFPERVADSRVAEAALAGSAADWAGSAAEARVAAARTEVEVATGVARATATAAGRRGPAKRVAVAAKLEQEEARATKSRPRHIGCKARRGRWVAPWEERRVAAAEADTAEAAEAADPTVRVAD